MQVFVLELGQLSNEVSLSFAFSHLRFSHLDVQLASKLQSVAVW